ncbi:hypothetical protein A3A76_03195 [Candidatus Woesebacteria bacterium RIFCSPLOWO2_01_FULL_39_23]|uniref:GGDEF domain-containing protein n=1 Tax=Candidatus Woesebacteria bacterium RIFCSPHIGHO2_01_FULL_40_22 TaxID=1802499 RepID=A0A1F7YJL8_9BACT|nr:MAG: hypothetical protein A2141_00830 [Candidatus Woesebacteria bacterium RBG_16_40_11]OGM27467.1 MAG: hypothetical protein A2628_01595 [Candidatus Woesebacteria bacterium RIFCSPHIGHO2_01_FULL_40_22]OGM36575.1 MAG: hypothetical protein A3E41_04050 [Candidatus Woesebacteria bacterium RIFCSPHIGHO2_12_FULL_38_9]OGM62641.1 MAG: hypothetical protein A3A76_03195 [Candidatus Woesebacteria bacterium RIFCSPLOWO2_01_FULL_39_23]
MEQNDFDGMLEWVKNDPEAATRTLIDQNKNLLVDTKTGLNSLYLFKELARQQQRILKRSGKGESVVSIADIDNFKEKINDPYGLPVGDVVIQFIAEAYKSSMRDSDIVGRYAGDEYIAYYPDTNINTIKVVEERIKSYIKDHAIEYLRKHLDSVIYKEVDVENLARKIDISTGYSQANPDDTIEKLITEADRNMHNVKKEKKVGR